MNTNSRINVPATPKDCEFRDDYLSYIQSGFTWGAALFLIVFWGIWTFFCGTMVCGVISDNDGAPPILFIIPFVLADVVVLSMLLYCLFGKEVGWMDETGFHREYRCLFIRLRKDVPLSSIRKFKIGLDFTVKQNKRPSICVQIVTAENDVNVMRSFAETDKQRWLVAAGNAVLINLTGNESVETSTPNSAFISSDEFMDSSIFSEDNGSGLNSNFIANNRSNNYSDEDSDELEEDAFESQIERFNSIDHIRDAEKPEGTDWKETTDFNKIQFSRKGKWTAGLLGALFVTAFWNGIVSVFICALFGVIGAEDNAPSTPDAAAVQTAENPEADQSVVKNDQGYFDSLKDKHMIVNKKPAQFFGWEWWIMFCFLIPFEIIGLWLILAFLSQLFAPFITQSWTFSSNTAIRTRSLFGIPLKQRFDLMDFSYLEIHHNQSPNKDSLVFYDRHDKKVLQIADLNRADARWIANEVLTML